MQERTVETTPTRESGARAEFIARLSPRIERLIKEKFPTKNYPPVVVPRIAHYLYGAHIVSQLAHSFLFEKDYGHNIIRLSKKPQFDENGNYTGGRLNPDDLFDWPINWIDTDPRPEEIRKAGLKSPMDVPFHFGGGGEFSVPIGYFAEFVDLDKEINFVMQAAKGVFASAITIRTTMLENDICTGIHEAGHALLDYFEIKKKLPLAKYPNLGEREDVTSRSRIFKREGAISYLAELGDEFANFLIWNQILREELPDIWARGYQKVYEEVIKWRRKKLKDRGKSPDEPIQDLTSVLTLTR